MNMHKDGIVVKVTKQYIVLLCNDGTFQNVKRTKGQIPLIGEKIILKQKKNTHYYSYLGAMAAIACAVLFMISSPVIFHKKDTPTAYVVAIDINPSVEVQVNKDLYAIGLTALNQDGEKIIKAIEYRGKGLDETIDSIISQSIIYDFLGKNSTGLIATSIIPINMNENIDKDKIKSTIDKSLAKNKVHAEVQVSVDKKETMEAAHALGLTVNKYKLYKSLLEDGLSISAEEAKKYSVNDLLKLVNTHPKTTEKSNDILTNLIQSLDIELEQSTPLKNKLKSTENNNTTTKNAMDNKIENPGYVDEKQHISDDEDIEGAMEDEESDGEESDEDTDTKETHGTIQNKFPIDSKDQENREPDNDDKSEIEDDDDDDGEDDDD